MKQLSKEQTKCVSGGSNAKEILGAGGLAYGAIYGAAAGASIAGPIALVGWVFALSASPIVFEGVLISGAIFAGGVTLGAAIGGVTYGAFGLGIGAMADAIGDV